MLPTMLCPAQRLTMSRIDVYLMQSVGRHVGLCCLLFAGMIYLGELYTLGGALDPLAAMSLSAAKLLGQSSLIVPLASVLGTSFTFYQLRQPLIALKACGLSWLRITRSLWLLALLGVAFVAFCELWAIDWAFSFQSQTHTASIYQSPDAQERWFFDRLQDDEGQGLMLSFFHGQTETQRFLATQASYQPASQTWLLHNVRHLVFDQGTLKQAKPLVIWQSPPTLASPERLHAAHIRPENLSLTALYHLHKFQKPLLLWTKFISLWRPLLAIGLAIAIASRTLVRPKPLAGILPATGAYAVVWALTSVPLLL